jgi:uncharacterized Zn finger protein
MSPPFLTCIPFRRLGGRFSVICSCPDGERQAYVCTRLSICKHAAAALETVVDRDAAVRKKEKMEEDRKKAVAERERKAKEEAEVCFHLSIDRLKPNFVHFLGRRTLLFS